MKKSLLKKLILEEFQNHIQEEEHIPVDEIGKFFVVKKPSKGTTRDNIVYEATVFDDIDKTQTIGVYKNKSEANREAAIKLQEFENQLKEVESSMEEYRNAKKDIDNKKEKAKNLILKIK